MRTYDKLIATICSSQGPGSLRPAFGLMQVGLASRRGTADRHLGRLQRDWVCNLPSGAWMNLPKMPFKKTLLLTRAQAMA